MNHLEHLGAVAAEDVRFVLMREATYMGSWKREGGRSAWFNLKRKIDRLCQMMKRPPDPDVGFNMTNVNDTIAAIQSAEVFTEATNGRPKHVCKFPGTSHATVAILQYLRDCYIAENIFAGIRKDPSGTDGTVLAEVRDLRRYLLLVEAEMIARNVVGKPERPRPTVAELEAILKEPAGKVVVMPDGSVTAVKKPYRGECTLCCQPIESEPVEYNGLLYHQECWVNKAGERMVPRYEARDAQLRAVGLGAVATNRLEDGEANSGQFSAGIRDPLSGTEYQLINRHILPTEQWDHLPRLAIELNNKEWEEARPEYRGLYEWYEDPSKWVMRPAYREHWGRQP